MHRKEQEMKWPANSQTLRGRLILLLLAALAQFSTLHSQHSAATFTYAVLTPLPGLKPPANPVSLLPCCDTEHLLR